MFGSKNGRVILVIGTVGVFRVELSLMMIMNWGNWIESDFFMELLVCFVYLESDSELTIILGRDVWFKKREL